MVGASDKYDHLLLYAHGGLNSVEDSARRISAMKETFKANRIYPFHFMYDTGLLEELKDVLAGRNKDVIERAGGLPDWTDHLIERSTQKAGRALWRQMKLGAERPFREGGAGLSVLEEFLQAFGKAPATFPHVVGRSTGAILHAYLLTAGEAVTETTVASASLLRRPEPSTCSARTTGRCSRRKVAIGHQPHGHLTCLTGSSWTTT
jgi:hypothetical protein